MDRDELELTIITNSTSNSSLNLFISRSRKKWGKVQQSSQSMHSQREIYLFSHDCAVVQDQMNASYGA